METSETSSVDVLIVGAGPIGIETAIVLHQEGHNVLVVDAGPVGATIERTFPPDTRFFTSPERLAIRGTQVAVAAQEKATGEEYLTFLRNLVSQFDVPVQTFQRVVDIAGEKGAFEVTLQDRAERTSQATAKLIVLATGGTDHPRQLGIPGEDLPFVDNYLADPHRYFQRRVAVVGGRNSAAETALRLYRAGAFVALVHRQPDLHERVKFWIRPEVEALMAEGLIRRVMPARIIAIEPGRLIVHQLDADRTAELPIDDVLLQVGFTQDQTLFTNVGIKITDDENCSPFFDEKTLESNVPGIYLAGTATAGTQSGFTTFIENCHQHADRIAAALAGRPAPPPQKERPIPEM